MRAMRTMTAASLLVVAACVGGDAAPDASLDAHVIIVPDPIDAPLVLVDAAPRDAAPEGEAPIFDAFPCLTRSLDLDVATLAGCAAPGAVDGARSVAKFNDPVGVALGPDGDVYVADHANHRIRAVKPDGATRTVVDQGDFRWPRGVVFASDGTLYVTTEANPEGRTDDDSGTLWIVDGAARRATVVLADVGRPAGLAALEDGRVAMADPVHHTVRLLVKTQEMDQPPVYSIEPLAGADGVAGFVNATGGAARFREQSGIAALPDGSVVVADRGNHRIRRVTPDGAVTTFAGRGGIGREDGAAADARFSAPLDVAADDGGDVWVSDGDNHVIRKIAGGEVTTVAGIGTGGYEDSEDRMTAAFFGMEGIEVAPDGQTVWVADGTRGDDLPYHRVRRIRFP